MLLNLKGVYLAIELHVDRKALLGLLPEGSANCRQAGGLPSRYCVGVSLRTGGESGPWFLDGGSQPRVHVSQGTCEGRFERDI